MSDKVMGYCPACGNDSLFLGGGGYVTCSIRECPEPSMASNILLENREVQHIVVITDDSFTIRHPLRERAGEQLEDCSLHAYLTMRGGPPVAPGRYCVWDPADEKSWWTSTWMRVS